MPKGLRVQVPPRAFPFLPSKNDLFWVALTAFRTDLGQTREERLFAPRIAPESFLSAGWYDFARSDRPRSLPWRWVWQIFSGKQ